MVGGGGSGGSTSGRPRSAMLNTTMSTIDLTPKNSILNNGVVASSLCFTDDEFT